MAAASVRIVFLHIPPFLCLSHPFSVRRYTGWLEDQAADTGLLPGSFCVCSDWRGLQQRSPGSGSGSVLTGVASSSGRLPGSGSGSGLAWRGRGSLSEGCGGVGGLAADSRGSAARGYGQVRRGE